MYLLVLLLFAALIAAGQEQPQSQSAPSITKSQNSSATATAPGGSSAQSSAPTSQQAEGPPSQSVSASSPNNSPGAPQQSAQTQTPSSRATPVVRVTTRLVLVDVVVTDSSGRPVTDLKSSDFDVRENGKTQKVVAFAFQPPPKAGNGGYKPLSLAPGVVTNIRNLNGDLGPPTILLIDALNTPFKDQPYLRQQLLKYLDHVELGRNVAIYTLGTRLRMIQDFTSDPELLHDAMKKITVHSSMFNGEPQDFADEFPGLDPDSSDQSTAQMAQQLQEFESEQEAFQRDIQVRLTMDAMQELAHNVAGYPGRKNLVWLSGSFPLTIFPDETSSNPFNIQRQYGDDLRKTAALFSNNQIAVYPVDARGLVGGFLPDASQRGSSMAGPRAGPNALRAIQQGSANLAGSHDTMNELASQTGGRAFYNRNDIDHAIALSVAEGSTYYTLAYYPEDKRTDGKFRKIEVKLDRKGLQSRYRKGYFVSDTQPMDEKLARAEFIRALAPDAPITTAIPFLVRVTPPAKERKELTIDFSVLPRSIRFEAEGGLEHADVEFVTRIFDSKGKVVGTTESATLSTQLKPATYNEVMTYGLRYRQTMNLPPGKYVLKMGVRDHQTNAMGTLVTKVEVPQG
jgi:VWFA-related protein